MYCISFDKSISVAIDGASVMTGVTSGVTTLFNQNNSYIIKTYCIVHRLALAANPITYLKTYQGTINEIYKYHHYSCKHMASLKAMGVIFDKAEKKLEEVFGTRCPLRVLLVLCWIILTCCSVVCCRIRRVVVL